MDKQLAMFALEEASRGLDHQTQKLLRIRRRIFIAWGITAIVLTGTTFAVTTKLETGDWAALSVVLILINILWLLTLTMMVRPVENWYQQSDPTIIIKDYASSSDGRDRLAASYKQAAEMNENILRQWDRLSHIIIWIGVGVSLSINVLVFYLLVGASLM